MQPAFRSGRAQVRNALQCLRLPVAFLGCCTAVSVLEWQGGVGRRLCEIVQRKSTIMQVLRGAQRRFGPRRAQQPPQTQPAM